ncbi:hypothetical protein P308_32635 [Pseudomonas piscis]|nr:hypothetical protein P308_32635 [Pseudomonas piscis]
MPAQGPGRAVHLFCQSVQAGSGIQLRRQQLADAPEPGLAPGELGVLLATALGHGLVGDGIRQGQRLVEPAPVEGEGIAGSIEL